MMTHMLAMKTVFSKPTYVVVSVSIFILMSTLFLTTQEAGALNFLIIYEFPIRLVSISILIGTYFLLSQEITSECKPGVRKS